VSDCSVVLCPTCGLPAKLISVERSTELAAADEMFHTRAGPIACDGISWASRLVHLQCWWPKARRGGVLCLAN
jgi:hypothetical protein